MKPGRSSAAGAASWIEYLDRRPIVVALAGPNGAGKSTFFEAHLKSSGLRFLNADVMSAELEVDAYEAARMIAALRTELVRQRESFIFETVFSDPVGDKLGFLKQTAESGYAVVMCFIAIADAGTSEQRVAMRVSQGGHDVPTQKLFERFPRTIANLAAAIRELPCVLVFNNDDLRTPFRHVATFVHGQRVESNGPAPFLARAPTLNSRRRHSNGNPRRSPLIRAHWQARRSAVRTFLFFRPQLGARIARCEKTAHGHYTNVIKNRQLS